MKFASVRRKPDVATVTAAKGFWSTCLRTLIVGTTFYGMPLLAIERDGPIEARESIRIEDLQGHLHVLADDAMEGREAGSRGGYAAGNYGVRTFQEYLEPGAGHSQYFQVFGSRYRNVLGILPGKDPELRDEFILIGGHYDHVGYGSRRNSNGPIGFIHNGADDNASGVAAILELIESFGTSPWRPSRSILFALWDGEEKGLLGSRHWIREPTVPLEQIRVAINLDMIGRLRHHRLEVLGTRSMPGLRRIVAEANINNELTLSFPWKLEPNSDHHPFFQRRIPVLMFHTGTHEDYHRPSDDVEAVNFEGIQQTTRLVFQTLAQLADAENLYEFRDEARFEGTQAEREFQRILAAPVPRLGVSWLPIDTAAPPGLQLNHVRAGSAADRAGLRPADRLVTLNGHTLLASSTLQQVVVCAESIELTVIRDDAEEPLTVDVQLDGNPHRLGLSWRYSTAEPTSVTIVRLIRHSVADQAGLRVGDRIHRLDGVEFQNAQGFRDLANVVNLPTSIQIERSGQIFRWTLPALPRELTPTPSAKPDA